MRTYLIKDTFITPLNVREVTKVATVKATSKVHALDSLELYLRDPKKKYEGFELVELHNKSIKTLMFPTAHLHNNKAGRKAIDPLQKKVKFISYIKAHYLEPFKGKIPGEVLEQIDNSIISILEQNTPKK